MKKQFLKIIDFLIFIFSFLLPLLGFRACCNDLFNSFVPSNPFLVGVNT